MAQTRSKTEAFKKASSPKDPAKPPAKRPMKRIKTQAVSEELVAAPVKAKQLNLPAKQNQRGLLSALPSMPMDVLYEIFGQLPPGALTQLSRVSKAFRKVVLSRRDAFLWKNAFKLAPELPPCPEDMSEPAWSHLLFGGANCQVCRTRSVHKVIYILRRRVCKACMAKNLIPFGRRCESYDRYTFNTDKFHPLTAKHLALVPSISPHEDNLTQSWHLCYRWKADVLAMQDQVAAIIQQQGGVPSESDAAKLGMFIKEKKKYIAKRIQHAKLCKAWDAAKTKVRAAEIAEMKVQRFEDVKSRLLNLGHDEADINELRWHHDVNVAKPLTESVWDDILLGLKYAIDVYQERRLAAEVEDRRQEREALVVFTYLQNLETLSIRMAPLMPDPRDAAMHEDYLQVNT